MNSTSFFKIEEVRNIIDQCHNKAKEIIGEHKDELVRIAKALMEYETLTSEQIERIVKGESIDGIAEEVEVDTGSEE